MPLLHDDTTSATDLIRSYVGEQNGLLPALHALQDKYGCIDRSYHLLLSDAFNLSQAEIKGVVSFYHDFKDKPLGKHTLRICQAEACSSVGAAEITRFVKELTGLTLGETAEDKSLTVEAVYCLGLCSAGPAIELDGRPMARVTPEKLLKTGALSKNEEVQ